MAGIEQAMLLGLLAAARGQRSRAREQFNAAAAYGGAGVPGDGRAGGRGRLTAVRLDQGASQDAWATAEPAVAMLRRAGAWARGTGLLPVAVEAALACGHRQQAERLADDAEHGLRGRDAPGGERPNCGWRAAGLLLQDAEPAGPPCGVRRRARGAWQDIGRPYDTARAAELARTGAGRHRPAGRGRAARRGGRRLHRLGAAADAARCRQTLQELGLTQPAPRGRRGYGDELSPRERQVAELVARGATNQDIADAPCSCPPARWNSTSRGCCAS